MQYQKTVVLKDGRECVIRNGMPEDARAVLDNFLLTHSQTDYLTSYPEEITFTVEKEEEYLRKRTESDRDAELIALLDGAVAGTAGIDRIGGAEKLRHRANFGISVDKAFWGLGIGRALTEACLECARAAGYTQVELEAVADNRAALSLYESAGFVEFGRNPRGFRTREGQWQELVLMRLALDG